MYAATRGFHHDFATTAPGKVCDTFDELLRALRDQDFETEKVDAFVAQNFNYVDTSSSDRVIDWLILGEPRRAQGDEHDRRK